jgi:hypothetical protein
MRALHLALIALPVLTACKTEDKDEGEATPQVSGAIAPDGEGIEADVTIYKAFAMHSGSGFAAYLSNNPDATCDMVTEYLTAEAPHDPSDFLVGGACDVAIRIDTWEDGSGRAATDDPLAAAGFSINCYFGDEGWELETRDNDDRDYYWQGREWQGSPAVYSYDFSEDGDNYSLDLDMSAYNGSFIYESLEAAPASGGVTGVIKAERCESIATTPFFPN